MRAFRSFRRAMLICSLVGMAVSAVMFLIPIDLYMKTTDHDAQALNQVMWLLFFIFGFLWLLVSVALYAVKLADDPGPIVIRR